MCFCPNDWQTSCNHSTFLAIFKARPPKKSGYILKNFLNTNIEKRFFNLHYALTLNRITFRHERESLEKLLQHYIARDRPSRIEFVQPQKNALQLPKSQSIPPCNQSAEVDKAFVVTNSIQFYSNGFCLDHLGDPVMVRNYMFLFISNHSNYS